MTNAVTIINQHALIANLTHLLKMDNGGLTYYLLEHENISDMINNVSHQLYEDVIIVNRSFQIVYSMHSMSSCGKPLSKVSQELNLFMNTLPFYGTAISKPFEHPPLSGNYCFGIIIPLNTSERNQGFLIGVINQRVLYNVLPEHTIIVDENGSILFDLNRHKAGSLSINDILNKNNINVKGTVYSIKEFKFNNIHWYILCP